MEQLEKYYKSIEQFSKHTIRSYKYALNNFIKYFNINNFEDFINISPDNIIQWRDTFIKNKRGEDKEKAKRSANSRLRAISAFYTWLIERGFTNESPIKNDSFFKEQRSIKKYLTQKERDRMINSCSHIQSKLILAMAFYTGMRRDELVNIKINDINDGKILIHGKGNKERVLALNQYVLDLLNKFLKMRNDTCEYLFVSSKQGFGDNFKDGQYHQISGESIRQIVKTAAKKSGLSQIDKIAPHTCRRTFAVHLILNGASSFQVQKALAHNSIVTTERYLSGAGSEIADSAILQLQSPQ